MTTPLEKARQVRQQRKAEEEANERTYEAKDGCQVTVYIRVLAARCGHGLAMRERR